MRRKRAPAAQARRTWYELAAESAVPTEFSFTEEMEIEITGTLPVMNLIRKARGERELTLDEAIDERHNDIASGRYAAQVARRPQLIAEARALDRAAQQKLAALTESESGT